MNYRDPQLCELLAGQYVLGTLSARARRRFEGLLPGRPDLRRQVAAWEHRLPEVLGQAPAEEPPAAVWNRLNQRLFAEAATPPASAPRGLFERLGFWRGWAFTSSLLASVFALALLLGRETEIPGYVTTLASMKTRTPMWVVSASPEMDRLYVRALLPMDVPHENGCLLWIKPEGSDQYYLLGSIPEHDGADKMLKIDRKMRPMLKGELYVTVEPVAKGMPEKPAVAPSFAGNWVPIKI